MYNVTEKHRQLHLGHLKFLVKLEFAKGFLEGKFKELSEVSSETRNSILTTCLDCVLQFTIFQFQIPPIYVVAVRGEWKLRPI